MDSKTKKLRDLWYRKLAKSGFEDIETHDGKYLKHWDSQYFVNRKSHLGHRPTMTTPRKERERQGPEILPYTSAHFQSTQDYYYRAEHFLNEYKFSGSKWRTHKMYWKLHVDGLSNREIAQKCGRHHKTIGKIINALRKVMLAWKS